MSNPAADDPAVAKELRSFETDVAPPASLGGPADSGEKAPPCPKDALVPVNDTEQETDLWLGSYSGWTMLPSFLVCLALTALIFWFVSRFLPHRELVQLTILGASSAVWLAQLVRWGYRFFGFNYRLTTRRLFQDLGFLYPDRHQVELAMIADVRVECKRFDHVVGVGRLRVSFHDKSHAPLILEGVWQPHRAAELIREACRNHSVRQNGSPTAGD